MTTDDRESETDRRDRIEQALGAFLLASDRDEKPDPAEWAARYPELQSELGDLLLAEAELHRLARPLSPVLANDPRRTDDNAATIAEAGPQPSMAEELTRGTAVRYFGDYEILSELGRGGMGVVYRAKQLSLNRQVALKMIRAGLLADDAEARRFQNEAEAVARLDHVGIVPIYEVGERDSERYFSMKLVSGGSLAGLPDHYRDDPQSAALLVIEMAEAIHHAHQRGILHRDLKPANILLDEQGHPHITDFGLAKIIEGDSEQTQSGTILGTPAYMAPEQAGGRNGEITTGSDVYGLGAVLYALLTGKAPFGGSNVLETLQAVRERPPELPSKLNPKVPRDLEVICLKCLEKDQRRRYDSASALAHDLERWLGHEPILARPVGPATRIALWVRRKPVIASLVGSLCLAVVVGAVSVTILWRRAETARAKAEQRLLMAATAIGQFVGIIKYPATFDNQFVMRGELKHLRELESTLADDPSITAQMTLSQIHELEAIFLIKLERPEEAYLESLKVKKIGIALARRHPEDLKSVILVCSPTDLPWRQWKLPAHRSILEQTLAIFDESVEILDRAVKEHPPQPDADTKFLKAVKEQLPGEAESIRLVRKQLREYLGRPVDSLK